MKVKLVDNGIILTVISALVFGLAIIAEVWSIGQADRPAIVKVTAQNNTSSEEFLGGEANRETLDEVELTRSEAHQQLLANPEITIDKEVFFSSLSNLLSEEGVSPVLLNDLAVLAISTSRYKEAVDYLNKSISLQPDYAKTYVNLGVALSRLDKNQQAELAYSKALEINPGYQKAAINLGVSYLNANRLPAAEELFSRAAEMSSGDNRAQALRLQGTTLIRTKEFSKAAEVLRRATEYNPRDPVIWLELGRTLSKLEGKSQAAIEAVKNAIALDSEGAKPRYRLGEIYNDLGLWKQAMKEYQAAIRLEPTHISARKKIAGLLEDHGDVRGSRVQLEWLARNLTEPGDVAMIRSKIAEFDNDQLGAISILMKELQQSGPVDKSLLRRLGLMLRKVDKYSSAIKVYDQYITAFPEETDAFVGAAGAALGLGLHEKAEHYIDRGISVNAKDKNLWFMQGRLLNTMGKPDKAILSYESCLKIRATDRKCALNLAVLKRRSGKDEEVVAIYRDILGRSPNYVPARFNLALVLSKLRRSSEAADQYEEILRLESDNVRARTRLAAIRISQRRLDQAEQLLRDGLDIDPSVVITRYDLAMLLGERGNTIGKMEELERVTRLDSKFSPGWRSLGVAQLNQGDADAAKTSLLKAFEINPQESADALSGLAIWLDRQGKPEKSMRLLKQILTAVPGHQNSSVKLAEIRLRSNTSTETRTETKAERLPVP